MCSACRGPETVIKTFFLSCFACSLAAAADEECQARKAQLQAEMAKAQDEADIRNRTGEKARGHRFLARLLHRFPAGH